MASIAYKNSASAYLAFAAVIAFSILMGVVAAFSGWVSILATLVPAIIIGSFFVPIEWLVFVAWFTSALLAGSLEYFLGKPQGFWVPNLIGLLLILVLLVKYRFERPTQTQLKAKQADGDVAVDLILWIALLWLITVIFSTVLALPSFAQIIVAAKNYIFIWGFFLAIIWHRWDNKSLSRIWSAVVLVACFQLPLTLYQRFFVAAKRHDYAGWDAVVGSFGGNPERGGHSAAMALVACLAVGVLLLRWRSKQLSGIKTFVLAVTCIAPVMLAEVKMVIIWALITVIYVFGQEIKRRFLHTLLLLLAGIVLVVLMAVSYKAMYYDNTHSTSWAQVYDKQIKYAVDPDEFNVQYKRLGRMAALKFWGQKNNLGDPVYFFLGYGLGASRSSSSIAVGELTRRYPFEIDASAASTLLWDSGVLGAGLFFLLLGTGSWAAFKSSQRPDLLPENRLLLSISGLALFLIFTGFAYNRDAIDAPAIQILLFVSLGQVLLVRHQSQQVMV